jgi:hypothetical protein
VTSGGAKRKFKGRASSNEKLIVYRLLGAGCHSTILAPRASVAGRVPLLLLGCFACWAASGRSLALAQV